MDALDLQLPKEDEVVTDAPDLILPKEEEAPETLADVATGVLDIDPDQFAKAKQYGRVLDEDPNYIYNNMPNYDKAFKNPGPDDFESFEADYPKAASWLKKDPGNLAVAKDSLADLGVVDFAISNLKKSIPNAIGRAILRGPTPQDVEDIKAGAKKVYDWGSGLVEEMASSTPQEEWSKLKGGVTKGWNQITRTQRIIDEMHNTFLTGKVTPGFLEEEQAFQASQPVNPGGYSPLFDTGEQGMNMLAVARKSALRAAQAGLGGIFVPEAAPVLMATGAKVGAFEGSYEMEAAAAFPEYLALKDKDGKPVDPRMAATYAMGTGLINAGFEMANLSIVLKTLPGGGKLLNALSKNPKIFAQATKGGVVRTAVKNLLMGVLSENVTEQAQNVASKFVEKEVTGDFPSWERIWDESYQTASAVTKSTLTLGLFGAATNAHAEIRQINKANKVKEDLNNVSKALTKLKERDPEAAKDLVDHIAKEADAESIYIPIKNFNEYWQTKDINPEDAVKELGVQEEYNIAKEEEGSIKIPLSTITDKVVGTEHYNGLVDHMKFDPNDMTVFEAKEAEQNTTREMEAEVEAVKNQAVNDAKDNGEFEQVQKFYVEQLKNAFLGEGIKEEKRMKIIEKWATVAASTDITQARRQGKTLVEYYKDAKMPKIVGEDFSLAVMGLKDFGGLDAQDLAGYGVTEDEINTLKIKHPKLIQRAKAKVAQQTYRDMVRGRIKKSALSAEEHSRITESRLWGLVAKTDKMDMKEKGVGLDVLAQEMISTGDLVVPADRNEADYLMELLVDNKPVFHETGNITEGQATVKEVAESMNLTPEQFVDRLLGKQEEFVYDEKGNELFQTAPAVDSEAFKKWFGDSKVVDSEGKPLIVYHGTTHSFEVFDKDKINIENDLGKEFYFSNDYADVETNYAGEGPDLTNRIAMLAERIEANEEIPYEEAKVKAKEQLVGGEGKALEVYLSIKNPAVLGGEEETRFDFNYDEETEEESGTLLDFVESFKNVASDFSDVRADEVVGEVLEKANYEDIKLSDLITVLKSSEGLMYATDEEGNLASNEIIRMALEGMGFDGVIDYSVNDKFGYNRKVGKQMDNIDENTIHYIVFEPSQVKSVYNKGTFDASNPNIMFQGSEDPLFKKAREYKNVEDFIKENSAYREILRITENPRSGFPKPRKGWTKDKIKKQLRHMISSSSKQSFNKAIASFDNVEEFRDNLFYHGSGSSIGGLKPSITFKGDFQGGGGYGEKYWGISLSKDRNTASNFSGINSSGSVAPVVLKKNAKVKVMPEIQDAVELEDHIEKLWDEGIDAVKIGDWKSDFSEQEIVILNPKAIAVGPSESFQVFQKEKKPSFDDKTTQEMFDSAYDKYLKTREEDFNNSNASFKEKYGRDKAPLTDSTIMKYTEEKKRLADIWNKANSSNVMFQNSNIVDGKNVAAVVKDIGTDDGNGNLEKPSKYLINQIKKYNYTLETVKIDAILNNDETAKDYVDSGELRSFEEDNLGTAIILDNNGRLLDGYNRLLQHVKNGEQTIQAYKPIPWGMASTKTKAFKTWFEGSQVVDKNGDPLVVYHGTSERFNEFEYGYSNFFAEDIKHAKGYGKNIMPVYLSAKNLFDYERPESIEKMRPWITENIDAFNAQDGMDKDGNSIDEDEQADSLDHNNTPDSIIESLKDGIWQYIEQTDGFVDELKRLGFDGFTTNEDGRNYAIFDSRQVKSVNNKGTFNPKDSDIYFQNNPYGSEFNLNLRGEERSSNSTLVKGTELVKGEELDPEIKDEIKSNDYYKFEKMKVSELKDKKTKFKDKRANFGRLIVNLSGEVLSGYNKVLEAFNSGLDAVTVLKAVDKNALFQNKPIAPPMYSAVEKAVQSISQEKATPDQWLAMIKKMTGVKEEEVQWLGLDDWFKDEIHQLLRDSEKTVTKQELLDYVQANKVQIKEVTLGGEGNYTSYEELPSNVKLLVAQYDDGNGELTTHKFHDELYKLGYDAQFGMDGDLVSFTKLGVKPTKFAEYTLPGGENYREFLVTMPVKKSTEDYVWEKTHDGEVWAWHYNGKQISNGFKNEEDSKKAVDTISNNRILDIDNYRSPHFSESNILYHVRFNERTDADGNRVLFIEEVQSDWHQKGREDGYGVADQKELDKINEEIRDTEESYRKTLEEAGVKQDDVEAISKFNDEHPEWASRFERVKALKRKINAGIVPDAPLKKSWQESAFRRMVRWAAENGFDKVAWTTGEQQADRYSLAKTLDKVRVERGTKENTYSVYGWKDNSVVFPRGGSVLILNKDELPNYIGKELSQKVIEDLKEKPKDGDLSYKEYTGLDLKVGGDGMKGFYDQILVKYAEKFAKKFESKVELSDIATTGKATYTVTFDGDVPTIDSVKKELDKEKAKDAGKIIPARVYLLNTIIEEMGRGRTFQQSISWAVTQDYQARMLEDLFNVKNVKMNRIRETTKQHSLSITPTMREAALSEGFPLFQERQGAINFEELQTTISLYASANASTFIHEFGHKILKDMGDWVRSGKADAQYMKDFAVISSYLAFNVTQKEKNTIAMDRLEKSYESLTAEEKDHVDRIADQELFARTFEKYLMDGKAPTEELRSVFSTFKRLLTAIYKTFSQGVADIEISDEVRGVMDRIIATDEQIEATRLRKGELDTSKMSPEMAAKVEGLRESAREQAYGLLMEKQMEELTKKHLEFLDTERKAKTEEVTKAVKESNFYATSELLMGKLKNEDIKDLAQKMLDKTLTPEESLTFDTIAQLNGFENGFKLANDIMNANTESEEISSQVEEYMAQFANLKDTDAFKEEVERTIHNEQQEELLALENQIIKGMINKDRNDNLKAKLAKARAEAKIARETARKVLSKKSAKDAKVFVTYFNAERDAAKKVGEFLAKGNLEKAAEYKQKQLLNHALAREAIKVKKRYDKALLYIKKTYSKDMKLFKKDEHFNQVASLLSRMGFNRPDYILDSRSETLKEWDERFEQILGTNLISDWLFNEAAILDVKKLTIDQIEDVTDAMKNIQTIANQEQNFVRLMQKASISDHITKMEDAAKKNIKESTREKNKATVEKTLGQAITTPPKLYLMNSTKIQEMCRRLQGGDFGIWSETLVDNVNKAQDFRSSMMEDFSKQYTDLFEKYYPEKNVRFDMTYDQKFYKEFGAVMSKMRLIAMAMNMGAEKNRLLLFTMRPIGFDTNLVYNQKVVEDVLFKQLDKNDWMFVQDTWKLIGKLWPDGAAMVKELTGFEPKQIEAVPFNVRLKTGEVLNLDGGYFPLKADPRSSDKQETIDQLNNSLDKMPKSLSMLMTKTGRFKERNASTYPLMLDVGLIDRHIKDSIHDLAFRPVLIDLKRLIGDPRMKATIEVNLGPGGYQEIKQWLSDIAGEPTSARITTENIVNWAEMLRHNSTIATLAYKLSVLLQNAANPLLYGEAVDGYTYKDALKATYKMIFSYIPNMLFNTQKYKDIKTFVDTHSRMMKDREDSPDMTLKKAVEEYFGKHDALISALYEKSKAAGETSASIIEFKGELVEFGTQLMSFTDNISARPNWIEAYEKQIALGKSEEDAVTFANRLIDQTIGSGRKFDTAGIFRGSTFVRMLTMFKSFMNTQLNQWMRQYGNALRRQGHPLLIVKDPKFMAFVAIRTIAFPIVSAILSGKHPDEDDDDMLKWAMQMSLRDQTGLFIGVGDLTSVMTDNVLGVYSYGYRPSPVVGAVQSIVIDPFKEMNAYMNDDASIQDVLEKQFKAASYMFGYPDSLNQYFFNAVDYMDGTMTPEFGDLYKRRPESEK